MVCTSCLREKHWKIIFLVTLWSCQSALIAATQATVKVRITSFQPESGYVFDGSTIKLTCEASDTNGSPPNITWLDNDQKPVNNSTTTVTTWTKGNKTISVMTTSDIRPRIGQYLYLYCEATAGSGSTFKMNKNFVYVKDSEIPRFQVDVPQVRAVPEGTKRVVLVCQVSSNVEVKSATLRWIYGTETLQEKNTILEADKSNNVTVFLQCLSEKDLGNYTCQAKTFMYSTTWETSNTTKLTGNFQDNSSATHIYRHSIYHLAVISVVYSLTFLVEFYQ